MTDQTFRTKDLGLVTALATSGFHHLKIDASNDERGHAKAQFVYNQTDAFDAVVKKYFSGELLVPAQEFYLQIRQIKSLTFHALDSMALNEPLTPSSL